MEEKFLIRKKNKIVLKLIIREILKKKLNLLIPKQNFKPQNKLEIPKQQFQRINTKKYSQEINQNLNQTPPQIQKRIISNQILPPILKIPEPKFPPHLQYLNPIASEWELEIQKINNLIKNQNTRLIECNGEEKPLIVSDPIRRVTNITLNKEEIEKIIKIFSEVARIPTHEGINKIVVGDLVLTAIISQMNSTKFLIKKLRVPQNNLNLSMRKNIQVNSPAKSLY